MSTTRKFGGTGLGLSIVKQITELMGGDISVTSTPNVGTTFKLIVPIMSQAIDSVPTLDKEPNEHSETELHFRPLSVLVVEDNRVNAIVAQKFLASCGHETTWVEDGVKALDALQTTPFDLIVMDNHMPNMSGVETIKRIRQELQLKTVIFGCTADVFKDAHDDFIQAGADFVLTKPLQKHNLEKVIEQFKGQLFLPKYIENEGNNVIPLVRYPLEKLPMTEEELSQSPLLNNMGLDNDEKVKLLTNLYIEFEDSSILTIDAFTRTNALDLHKLLEGIKDIATEFKLTEVIKLAESALHITSNNQLPDAEVVQKLINLMHVNNHQIHRLLKQLTDHKGVG